jgi:hypothetical protein
MNDAGFSSAALPDCLRARPIDEPAFALLGAAGLGVLAMALAQWPCMSSSGGMGASAASVAAGMCVVVPIVLLPAREPARVTWATYLVGAMAVLFGNAIKGWFVSPGYDELRCPLFMWPAVMVPQLTVVACFAVPASVFRRPAGLARAIAGDRTTAAFGLWLMLAGIAGATNAVVNHAEGHLLHNRSVHGWIAQVLTPNPEEIVGVCIAALGLGASLRAARRARARRRWFSDVREQRIAGWRLDKVMLHVEEAAPSLSIWSTMGPSGSAPPRASYRLVREGIAHDDYREPATRPTLVLTLPAADLPGGPVERNALKWDMAAMLLSLCISALFSAYWVS